MALNTTVLAADFDFMVSDLPATIVWTPSGGAEQTVTSTRDEIEKTEENQLAGIDAEKATIVLAKISLFTGSVTPPVGDKLTLDSVQFRVAANIEAQDGVSVRLLLAKAT